MRRLAAVAMVAALGACGHEYRIDAGVLRQWQMLPPTLQADMRVTATRDDGHRVQVFPERLVLQSPSDAAVVRGRSHTPGLTIAGAVVLGVAGALLAVGVPVLVDGDRQQRACEQDNGWFCNQALPGQLTVGAGGIALLGGAILLAAGLSQHPAE